MRTIVTGASGFIGGRLLERLAGAPEIVALRRSDVDLADSGSVRRIFRDVRPGKVVHLAAHTARDAEDRQWTDTFMAGRNVLEAAADVGAEHVLAAGSVEELGDHEGVLSTELQARPLTTYGLCKSFVRELAAFTARRTGMRVDWFRPFTVYGPGQRGQMLVAYAFMRASRGEPVRTTDGQQQRDFVYVDDIIDWLAAAVDQPPDTAGRGELIVHHLGTGRGVRVADVLAAIAREFPSAKFELGAIPRRSNEPACQVAPPPQDGSRAPWGWAPGVSVEEGIAATAAWWRAQVR